VRLGKGIEPADRVLKALLEPGLVSVPQGIVDQAWPPFPLECKQNPDLMGRVVCKAVHKLALESQLVKILIVCRRRRDKGARQPERGRAAQSLRARARPGDAVEHD
jgi:hypothetical protein